MQKIYSKIFNLTFIYYFLIFFTFKKMQITNSKTQRTKSYNNPESAGVGGV